MTYNMFGGTLNHIQPCHFLFTSVCFIIVPMYVTGMFHCFYNVTLSEKLTVMFVVEHCRINLN